MSTLGMCNMCATKSSKYEDSDSKKTHSPQEKLCMSPTEAIKRYIFGIHAKTKRSLAEEAESGDDLSINSWIRDGADPNDSDDYGYSPLLNASTTGKLTAVRELVKGGADVNQLGPFGFSPLHAAAQGGHAEVVAYLLRNGADINAQNEDNDTPMHLALRAQNIEIVYQLLSSGGNSKVEGFNHKSCVECAAELGMTDLTRVLKNYCAFNETSSIHAPLQHTMSVM